MKTIVAAILSIAVAIFAFAAPADACAAEQAKQDIDADVVTELSQVPDGYDSGDCAATYVIAIAG